MHTSGWKSINPKLEGVVLFFLLVLKFKSPFAYFLTNGGEYEVCVCPYSSLIPFPWQTSIINQATHFPWTLTWPQDPSLRALQVVVLMSSVMLHCPFVLSHPLCERSICNSGRQFFLMMVLLLGIWQLCCDFLPGKMLEGCNLTLERLIQSVFTILTETQGHRRMGACMVVSRLCLELPLRTLYVWSAFCSPHQHMYSVILAFPQPILLTILQEVWVSEKKKNHV